MSSNRPASRALVVSACIFAAAASAVFAVVQFRAVRASRAEIAAAQRSIAALRTQVANWEKNVRDAATRATHAERDTTDLLAAVRAARTPQPVPPGRTALPDQSFARLRDASAEVQSAAPASTPANAPAMAPRSSDPAGQTGPYLSTTPLPLDEAQARLAVERAYQQDFAKRRAQQAKDRAAFDESTRSLDPAARFARLLDRAQDLAARAEFQMAIRTYNEAMTLKPADLPVPPAASELQALIGAQNRPVDISLSSDGQSYVSILLAHSPKQFLSTSVKLLPGDYHIVSRRPGFRDVVIPVKVRADAPLPVINVACTEPLPSK